MASGPDDANRALLSHVLVPVAHEEDAILTATALAPYQPEQVTVLHVVEKAGGAPDKTPVVQSEEIAEKAFTAVRAVFPDANDHTAYARNIVGTIFDTADEVDASAIVYRPRGGNRIKQFLSGDYSLKLVTQAECPVIALPHDDVEK